MLTRIPLGPWTLHVDVAATRAAYAAVPAAGPEACPCAECRNFVLARSRAYSPAAHALFAQIGAQPLRGAEVMHLGRGERGGYACVAWLHVIGQLDGPAYGTAPGYELAPGFKVWAGAKDDLAPVPLRGRALIQLEVAMEVPWLLDAPAPDADDASAVEA